jgi:hypothetical protein
LLLLEKVEVGRCFMPLNFGSIQSVRLHHFSDASQTSYGQCSYLRLVNNDNEVHYLLLLGKSRVSPLKPKTVPILELVAASISVMHGDSH